MKNNLQAIDLHNIVGLSSLLHSDFKVSKIWQRKAVTRPCEAQRSIPTHRREVVRQGPRPFPLHRQHGLSYWYFTEGHRQTVVLLQQDGNECKRTTGKCEITRCIFALKKMHRNEKKVVLCQISHRGTLHNKMVHIARF